MIFNNFKNIIGLRIRLFAITVILIVYLVLTYVAQILKFPILGISDTVVTIILVSVYGFFVFLPMHINFQYVSYSDEDDKISFKYFTSGIIGGRKNSVEIDKRNFSGFEVKSEFFGLRRSIILFQKFREGVAKYPPVYVSGLTRKEREKVIRSLSQYVPKS